MPRSTVPTNPDEIILRSELAAALDNARVALTAIPEVTRTSSSPSIDVACSQLDTISELLREIMALTGLLDALDGLSLGGAQAAAAATIAAEALQAAISMIRAALDEILAA